MEMTAALLELTKPHIPKPSCAIFQSAHGLPTVGHGVIIIRIVKVYAHQKALDRGTAAGQTHGSQWKRERKLGARREPVNDSWE